MNEGREDRMKRGMRWFRERQIALLLEWLRRGQSVGSQGSQWLCLLNCSNRRESCKPIHPCNVLLCGVSVGLSSGIMDDPEPLAHCRL